MRIRMTLAVVFVVAILAVLVWWQSPQSEAPPAIQVRSNDLLIQNQTDVPWSNVEVWVNDHYRGVAPELAVGQVLNVPLSSLVAGYGQRFDTQRQRVFGVLLTARRSDGGNVLVTWGKVRRR